MSNEEKRLQTRKEQMKKFNELGQSSSSRTSTVETRRTNRQVADRQPVTPVTGVGALTNSGVMTDPVVLAAIGLSSLMLLPTLRRRFAVETERI